MHLSAPGKRKKPCPAAEISLNPFRHSTSSTIESFSLHDDMIGLLLGFCTTSFAIPALVSSESFQQVQMFKFSEFFSLLLLSSVTFTKRFVLLRLLRISVIIIALFLGKSVNRMFPVKVLELFYDLANVIGGFNFSKRVSSRVSYHRPLDVRVHIHTHPYTGWTTYRHCTCCQGENLNPRYNVAVLFFSCPWPPYQSVIGSPPTILPPATRIVHTHDP